MQLMFSDHLNATCCKNFSFASYKAKLPAMRWWLLANCGRNQIKVTEEGGGVD